ncbi:MAG: ubiquinol-cytochrome c reductase iron-sulfur subunit [Candidatus Dormibacterales bacterium]
MSERGRGPEGEERRRAKRVDEVASRLLAGRRLPPRMGGDERVVRAAARMAAAREGYARMSPAFRARLEARLGGGAEGGMTRRNLLFAGAAGLAALAGGVVGLEAGRLTGATGAPAAVPGSLIVPEPGRWIPVAAMADLPEGQGVKVRAGAVSAYLFRRGESVSAVSAICSHLPCDLRWMSSEGLLLCPCHQKTFTTAGHSTSTAYPMPDLNKVMVKVEAGQVLVRGT